MIQVNPGKSHQPTIFFMFPGFWWWSKMQKEQYSKKIVSQNGRLFHGDDLPWYNPP